MLNTLHLRLPLWALAGILVLIQSTAEAHVQSASPDPGWTLAVEIPQPAPTLRWDQRTTRIETIQVALNVPSMPTVNVQTPTPELEATALYRLGLFQMTDAKFDHARALFERVKLQYPGTPAAEAAEARLRDLDEAARAGKLAAKDNKNGGRAEFVVTETLMGGYLGGLLSYMADITGQEAVMLPMLGLAGGLGGSLLYSQQNPMSVAQAAQFRATQLITLVNLTGWTMALSPEFLADNFALLQTIGVLGGTVGGHLVSRNLPMSEGQVALTTSAAVWTPLLVESLLIIASDLNLDARVYALAAPLATDAAILGSLWLAQQGNLKISRNRMMLINMGGGLGATFASGFMILIGGFSEARVGFSVITLGALAGLTAGYFATQDWDATNNPEVLARSDSPSMLTLEDGRIKLGRFAPTIRPEVRFSRTEDTEVRLNGTAFQLGLLGGTF